MIKNSVINVNIVLFMKRENLFKFQMIIKKKKLNLIKDNVKIFMIKIIFKLNILMDDHCL